MGDIKLTTLNFTGTDTALVLHPEWAMTEERSTRASHHRALNGKLYSYRWSSHSVFRVPLRFVADDGRSLLHGWWRDGVTLLFTQNTSADNTNTLCKIVNSTEPLGRRVAGRLDAWAGMLQLEAVDWRQGLGHPFRLDHPRYGLLDNPTISLI